ncbi:MAG: tyrosine-type recombinase/integrase [Candidatus Acidiferrales bacterium]
MAPEVSGAKAHGNNQPKCLSFSQKFTKDHLIAFMTHLKDKGKSCKALRDRIGSIEVFLRSRGLPKFIKKGDLSKVTKKLVDCYTEDEFNRMLAVADEDESFLLQFLPRTGVRKQKAAHMTWDDVKLDEHKVLVTAKPNCRCPNCGPDGFHIKDFEEHEIPDLDDTFVRLLAERKAKSATNVTNLLFGNGAGNPEGGMLFTLKAIGERAGIKCKNCVKAIGKESCKRHAIITHKLRRTFATWHNVLGGVCLPVLKQWLGHSDIETTMRYIATTEMRPGINKENAKKIWSGIKLPPQAETNVVSIRKSA